MNLGKLYETEYEKGFCELLTQAGWQHSFGCRLNRLTSETLYEKDLRDFLAAQYPMLSVAEYDAIVGNLRNIGEDTLYHTLRASFLLYRDGFAFNRLEADEQILVQYIDFEHPQKNIFRVTNQFVVSYAQDQTRVPDMLLLVNGIPTCIIELKNPSDSKATIADAYDQIHNCYCRDIPHLTRYTALSIISDMSNNRLGTTFTPYEHYYAWKKINGSDNTANNGMPELQTLIGGALTPVRYLQLLRDFVYFPDLKRGKEEEIVCRYPQFFATQALFNNILQHRRGNGGDGKGGTYFGATGCGKTYTMVFLARQLVLRGKNQLGSPTIVILVDREDLQTQAGNLFVNSSDFLCNGEVRTIDSRDDLAKELGNRGSGGVFICTIQKFCESTGLLSDRTNIICFSDEAHRTQNNLGSKLRIVDNTEKRGELKNAGVLEPQDKETAKLGAFITRGFAAYLRDALPNATYVGFTGTPTADCIHVFGAVVDKYTMREAVRDGITVDIKYIPRLARVSLNKEQAEAIEAYYKLCSDEGATPEDIAASKKAMSSMEGILGNEDRLARVAADIAGHYETMCADKPDVVQKAMIVCSNRIIAYKLYCALRNVRPDWFVPHSVANEENFSQQELESLTKLPMVNIVATRNKYDKPKEMYDLLGDKSYRQALDTQFKDENSNFRIAIVVDMWITGFDVPCLAVLYNDKPLQKHTLIQTISRVNRKNHGKEYGLIVDYIGIHGNMQQALKMYGGDELGISDDEIDIALKAFINELQIIKDLMHNFNVAEFFTATPLRRLFILQEAAEFVLTQILSEKPTFKTRFINHVKRMKQAFGICHPAGVLSDDDTAWAQFFMGVASYVGKMTSSQHDTESMNRAVSTMVEEAIKVQGVESLFGEEECEEDIFDEEFINKLRQIKMPNTKFQVLVKMLKKAIFEYKKVNKVAAKKFEDLLQKTIDEYNTRDNFTFTNDTASATIQAIQDQVTAKVDSLSAELVDIFHRLNVDKAKFKDLGISFEEKAFYDILVDIRDRNKFEYADERCIELSKKIKALIDDTAIHADWLNNNNLKKTLASNLMMLLYHNQYPPQWSQEIFNKVLDQVENFRKYN